MNTEIQINQENIFIRETVNRIASFTFYLDYTNSPNAHKTCLKLSEESLSYELWSFFFFCCTLIADRIRNSSPVNSPGYKPVWNFFSVEGNSKNSKILFSYKSVHGTEMFRKSLFEMTTVVS